MTFEPLKIKVSTFLVLVLFSIPCSRIPGYSQSLNSERNDETFLILALKKQKAAYDLAKSEYQSALELVKRELISREEFEKTKASFINQINYQQAMLRVIFDQPHILIEKAVRRSTTSRRCFGSSSTNPTVIEEAVKYQAQDGKKRVRLSLKNTTGGVADYEKLVETDADVFDPSLQPDKINNVFISLHEATETGGVGPIISQPYEGKIATIRFGQKAEIDFLLLKDVEVVTVSMTYAGKTDQRHIYLQKDAGADRVIVTSPNFSQEANLGESATFTLDLERFSSDNDVFQLSVINLPRQISYSFMDPSSAQSRRLSQVNFTQGVSSKQLELNVFLPDRTSDRVTIDKPLAFYVLVVPQEIWRKLQPLDDKMFSDEQIADLNTGKVKLEMTPRGVGRIEVRVVNLYHEIKTDDTVDMDIRVLNGGTRRLDNIRIRTNMPINWQSRINPDVISSLIPDKETLVKLKFLPPSGVDVGDYEIQIQTEALADNRPVQTQDKTVRIHVSARTNLILERGTGLQRDRHRDRHRMVWREIDEEVGLLKTPKGFKPKERRND